MKLAVVSLYTGDSFAELARIAEPGWRSYCRRFWYDFHLFCERIDRRRPPSWSKVLAVLGVLPAYDWVFWVDTDVLVWKPWIDLERFVADCDREKMVFQQDGYGLSCGAFFARNDPAVHRFLGKVYDQTQFVDHPWWEQAALRHLAGDDCDLIRLHPRGSPRPGFHGFFHEPPWDHVALHFPGIADRRALMERFAALAALPEDERRAAEEIRSITPA